MAIRRFVRAEGEWDTTAYITLDTVSKEVWAHQKNGALPIKSNWDEARIEALLAAGIIKELNDSISEGEGEGMAEEKREKVRASSKGWKVKDTVFWTGERVDAREWGVVKEITQATHLLITWDIGRDDAYYTDEEGNLYDPSYVKDYKDLPESAICGERREKEKDANVAKIKRDKTKDVDIVREGTQIILPPGMSFDEGIVWLQRKKEADEKEIAIYEVIEAFPLEGAYAFKRALDRVYGFTALQNTPGFFGSNPPTMIGLEVGPGETAQVPWGRLSVPGIAGFFETGFTVKDGAFKFVIQGRTKQKHKDKVRELAVLTQKIANDESIYKGKAIRVSFPSPEAVAEGDVSPLDHQPKFLNLNDVRPEDLIFPDDITRLVQTAIFTPIVKRERCQAEGVPFKRGVLLEGPWGVGKTLTAYVTAKKAVDAGVTFIYLDDVRQLEQALHFARLYQPAVVFAEDIDQVGRDDRTKQESPLNMILNTLDGVDVKSAQIMAVLTTNYINDIEQGLLRPGRIDAVIPVRAPDAEAAVRLVRLYSRGRLAAEEDLTRVGAKLAGKIPAVIREVVERAKLEAIGRTEGNAPLVLTAVDLEAATNSMLAHLKLLEPRDKDTRSDREKAAARIADAIVEAHVAPNGRAQLPEHTEEAAVGSVTH